jgi:nucleoside-diphosphate-sugar epimerase
VTEGTGLMGSHLVKLLVEKGREVFVIDNFERERS